MMGKEGRRCFILSTRFENPSTAVREDFLMWWWKTDVTVPPNFTFCFVVEDWVLEVWVDDAVEGLRFMMGDGVVGVEGENADVEMRGGMLDVVVLVLVVLVSNSHITLLPGLLYSLAIWAASAFMRL